MRFPTWKLTTAFPAVGRAGVVRDGIVGSGRDRGGAPGGTGGGIPELLRLADLKVRIPRLEVVALERLAEHDGRCVDTLLARHLLDLVSAHSAWLSQVIPGFAEALAWPWPSPASV